MYNNRHFDVKLVPEFIEAKFIIRVTLPYKLREDLMQVLGYKIWPQIEY
jgi:hypothetical protein